MLYQREVFTSGSYLAQFKPDEQPNPFRKIYEAKRADVLNLINQHSSAQQKVLDLGGGMGRIALPLAQRHQVWLCDISTAMLEAAARAAETVSLPPGHLHLHQQDAAQRLPFPDDTFSVAVCLDLLVHLSDPVETLREVQRVLAPDGMLLVDSTNSNPWWVLGYPRYVGRHPGRWLKTLRGGGVLPEWQAIVRHYCENDFRRFVQEAGFIALEERAYGPLFCPKWRLITATKSISSSKKA